MSMSETQHALIKMAEEANEIGKCALKIAQFGLESYNPKDPEQVTNLEKLLSELHDLEGTKLLLRDLTRGKFEFIPDTKKAFDKVDKIIKYREISQELGYVEKE